MIVSNRKYGFGGKVSVIHTNCFNCIVTTATVRLFKSQSTTISEIHGLNGISVKKPVAKITYSRSLRTSDRLRMHEVITGVLNIAGDGSASLPQAIDEVCQLFKERSLITTAIRLA